MNTESIGFWTAEPLGATGLACIVDAAGTVVVDRCKMSDADLIAASRDLLVAVRGLLDATDEGDYRNAENVALAAIAKATGCAS